MTLKIMAQLVPSERRFSGNGAWRNEPEEVDTAETRREADYLVGQYSMAYGPTHTVWAEEASDEEGEDDA